MAIIAQPIPVQIDGVLKNKIMGANEAAARTTATSTARSNESSFILIPPLHKLLAGLIVPSPMRITTMIVMFIISCSFLYS
ncbi:MAG: hypothetical protein ABIJ24_01795 [Nitrospinota bacterium]|nr:hypothetical protein [Nitrospinota bacterium]